MAFFSLSALDYSNLAQAHANENAKKLDKNEFEKVLRKKFARHDEDYDSVPGIIRKTHLDKVFPNKVPKAP